MSLSESNFGTLKCGSEGDTDWQVPENELSQWKITKSTANDIDELSATPSSVHFLVETQNSGGLFFSLRMVRLTYKCNAVLQSVDAHFIKVHHEEANLCFQHKLCSSNPFTSPQPATF
ncbi:hypothetical protein KSS87_016956 [Heliosperma pusillum]|nr:hypothetical protein KSS87_016956 [Heliosperma pusillum]